MTLFPSPGTATITFLFRPSSPFYAVEGKNLTLVWNYTLDGSLDSVQFSKVTGGGTDSIGSRRGPGRINSEQKYEARFRAQAGSTGAELIILSVQPSDEATYQLNLASTYPTLTSDSVKVIVHSKYIDSNAVAGLMLWVDLYNLTMHLKKSNMTKDDPYIDSYEAFR